MPTPTPEMLLTIARKLGQSISGKTGFMDQAMKGLGDNPKLAQYLQEALGHATVPSHLSGILEQPDLLQAAAAHFTEALKPHLYGSTAKKAIQSHIKSIPTPQNPGELQVAPSTGQIPEKYQQLISKASPGEQSVIQKILAGAKLPKGGVEHILRAMRERMGFAPKGSASAAQTRSPGGVGTRSPQPNLPGMLAPPAQATQRRLPFQVEKGQAKRKSGGRDLSEQALGLHRQIFPGAEAPPVPRRPSGIMPPGQRSFGDLPKPMPTAGVKKTPVKPMKAKPEAEDLAVRRARTLSTKRKEIK